ncbi:uncharacterized protein LOC105383173 [Plutella xylostella]|uniref:uncharacterized protein LOC105383173 n=1 Tax=Plutella xylostella TaxID=51655 RepID=UPI0020321AEC|nr:uncharacterized protein LOC105383173 [Plutella xylostella]XP_048487992.1 uncharacterized protein LOC105383173 [Plutella xylostella]
MDFVKREDQNLIDEESYKAYTEALLKQSQQNMDSMEYQHTAISMEQLHQVMQGSLTSAVPHGFQIPLSPRQMSTLMLKTNHISRNLHFSDIPTNLQRNLASEMELTHNLASDVSISHIPPNVVRNHHDDGLNRNLPEHSLIRSLANEMGLQQNIGLAQNLVQSLNEQMDLSRNLGVDMSQNLSRNDMLTQNLVRTDANIQQNVSHELDLTHHINRNPNIEQEMLEDSRSTPTVVQCVPDNMLVDQNGQRLVGHGMVHDAGSRQLDQSDHLLPMQFHIKSEQEDDGYFYESMPHGFANNIGGLAGHMPLPAEQAQRNPPLHQDSQIFSPYNNHINNVNVPALAPLDLYPRPQNYIQNYSVDNITRENPQNLVVHRQFENHSPYQQEEFKSQNGGTEVTEKHDEPKDLDPKENNVTMYYTEYNPSQNLSQMYAEKNENDSNEHNKIQKTGDDDAMNIKGEYICYKCVQIFPTKRSLKQHSKNCMEIADSEGEKRGKFGCSQCPYRSQSSAILKIHIRTHTGEKPFSCTFCDYKSGQKNNVAKHILVHKKEKPFRCQYCEYRCAQKNNLVVHERTHTGYKPFACPYCDYRTVQKPNLVKHMYLHTDQKPFSCDMCNYRCVQKTNLTKHKQRHLNEKDGEKVEVKTQNKPYRPRQKSVKCPHCSYWCVQKASLDKHMQFKHGDTNQVDNAKFSEENFEHGVNTMKNIGDCISDETIQNLSIKKDVKLSDGVSDKQVLEPLQVQS